MPEAGSKIAEAYVQIGTDLNPFNMGLATVKRSVFGLSGMRFNLPGAGLLATLGLGPGTLGITGAVLGFRHMMGAASDLNETVNMTKVVFGSAFPTIEKFVGGLADRFGIVKKEAYDAAASFGAFAQGQGFSAEASATFSAQITKLAADLTSAKNIRFEDAQMKMLAALSGEIEPLRRYGVTLSQVNVQNYALSHGIATNAKTMTEHQKILARTALIAQGLGFATNDLDRTITDLANATRASQGRFENLAADIGTVFLPAFKEAQGVINEFLIDLSTRTEDSRSTFESWADSLQSAFNTVGFVVRNFGDIVDLVRIRIAEYFEVFLVGIDNMRNIAAATLDWIGANWANVFIDAFDLVKQALVMLGTDFARFGKSAYDWIASGFTKPFELTLAAGIDTSHLKTTPFQPPALVMPGGMDKERQAVLDRIAQREQERADAMAGAQGGGGKAAEAAAGAMAAKESKAEIVNVTSIANELAKAALGQKDPLLKEAQATNEKLDAIAANTAKAAAGGRAKFAGP